MTAAVPRFDLRFAMDNRCTEFSRPEMHRPASFRADQTGVDLAKYAITWLRHARTVADSRCTE